MEDFPCYFDFTIRVKVKWSMNENKNIVASMKPDTDETEKFLQELETLCEKYGVKAESEIDKED